MLPAFADRRVAPRRSAAAWYLFAELAAARAAMESRAMVGKVVVRVA